MTMMATAHVLMKVLACALILRLNQTAFSFYMIGEMCLYLTVKYVRDDLRYRLRLKGGLSWIASFIIRIVLKTITDYTLIVQSRHSCELGGMYWSLNVAINQAFCFLSVYLYGKYTTEETGVVSTKLLFFVVLGLFLFSMLNFAMFLRLINQEHIGSFFSTTTSKQFACGEFLNGESDKVKFHIVGYHRSYYKSIEEDFKTFLQDNWDRWEEEAPEWFNAVEIAMVPSDLLPSRTLIAMGGVEGRRESINEMKAEQEEKKKGKGEGGSNLKMVGPFKENVALIAPAVPLVEEGEEADVYRRLRGVGLWR